MRLTTILLFLTSLAYGQADTLDTETSKFYDGWEFIKGPSFPVRLTRSGYTKFVVEPPDTATYIYEFTRRKKVWIVTYDSVTVDYNDNHASIVYSSGWATGLNADKFHNRDFKYGVSATTQRTATFSYTSDKQTKVRLWSERYDVAPNKHGKYTVTLDGGMPIEIDASQPPIISDKDRGEASWSSVKLPPGTHTVTISTSTQMVVDRFTVTTYTPK